MTIIIGPRAIKAFGSDYPANSVQTLTTDQEAVLILAGHATSIAPTVPVPSAPIDASRISSGKLLLSRMPPRYKIVAGRGQIGGQNSDSGGTNTTCMTLLALKPNMPFAIAAPRLMFTHFGVAGSSTDEYLANPSGTLTLRAAITANGVTKQATFGGAIECALNPGGVAVTDPLPIDIAASAAISVRYFISTASGNKWSRGQQIFTGLGDACNEAVGGSDQTLSGTITNTNGAGYAYSGLLGLTASPQLSLALLSDSIGQGQGDDATGVATWGSSTGNGQGYWGWFGRACYGATIPFLQLSRAGDQASFNQPPYSYRKNMLNVLSSGPIVDWVFVALGTNDATNGRTYTQLKADLTAIVADYQRRGVKVCICSITPKTTSTDSWATVANQTVASGHGLTDGPAKVNQDLRSGNWYNADNFFDLGGYMESSIGSCVWAAGYTADGLHPNQAAHIAVAAIAQSFISGLQPL